MTMMIYFSRPNLLDFVAGPLRKRRHQGFRLCSVQAIHVEGNPVEGVAAVGAEVACIDKRLLFLRHEKGADFRKPEVAVFFQLEIGKSRTAAGVLDGALQGDVFVPSPGAPGWSRRDKPGRLYRIEIG